jgi:putative transposase
MNKHNTIFGQLLALVSRSRFENLVKRHKTEYKAKGLRSWLQFAAMLFGQISGQHGLRSIETAMNSQRSSFYHFGVNENTEVKRSTLSYANNNRDAGLYKGVFETVLENAQKTSVSHGFKFKNPLYSVDATTIDLCLRLFPWADFRKNKGGIKLTVKLDHQGKIPCFAVESNAREHDSKKIKEIPFAANDVVVFDRGYTDYGYFSSLNRQKVWFVTRLKKNAKYRRVKKNEVKGAAIVSDYEILLPGYSKEKVLRKIIVRDPVSGKKIVLLTNNLKWAASTVSAIYRDRWQIELFFKAIKQNLKIKRFYGNSKNAVMTQIWIALIVYLLFYLLKVRSKNMKMSFTNFISVIRTMLFQRISLFEWLLNPSPPPRPPEVLSVQQVFIW